MVVLYRGRHEQGSSCAGRHAQVVMSRLSCAGRHAQVVMCRSSFAGVVAERRDIDGDYPRNVFIFEFDCSFTKTNKPDINETASVFGIRILPMRRLDAYIY